MNEKEGKQECKEKNETHRNKKKVIKRKTKKLL